jgi:GNAT superfamily N-acetyltransferase
VTLAPFFPNLLDTMPALITQCYASIIETYRILARRTTRGDIEEQDGGTLITMGVPFPPFNPLFVTHLPADPRDLIQYARSFYAGHNVPWCLRAIGEVADALVPIAADCGMTVAPSTPGLLLTRGSGYQPPLPHLTIRTVNDLPTLTRYNDILAAVFDLPREFVTALHTPALLHAGDIALYLGFVDRQPVATAFRCITARIAIIGNICTLPTYQRRGFGTAMTWHASLTGQAEGCKACFLEASPMGYPLYQRMGYEHVVDIRSWMEHPDFRRGIASPSVEGNSRL